MIAPGYLAVLRGPWVEGSACPELSNNNNNNDHQAARDAACFNTAPTAPEERQRKHQHKRNPERALSRDSSWGGSVIRLKWGSNGLTFCK